MPGHYIVRDVLILTLTDTLYLLLPLESTAGLIAVKGSRANEKAQYSHVSLSSKWHFHVLAQFLVAKKGGGDIGQKRERVVSMESFHKFSSHEISRAC